MFLLFLLQILGWDGPSAKTFATRSAKPFAKHTYEPTRLRDITLSASHWHMSDAARGFPKDCAQGFAIIRLCERHCGWLDILCDPSVWSQTMENMKVPKSQTIKLQKVANLEFCDFRKIGKNEKWCLEFYKKKRKIDAWHFRKSGVCMCFICLRVA